MKSIFFKYVTILWLLFEIYTILYTTFSWIFVISPKIQCDKIFISYIILALGLKLEKGKMPLSRTKIDE